MKYKFSNNAKLCPVIAPDGYYSAISVTERSCAATFSSLQSHISDRFCVRTVAEVVGYTAVFNIVTQRWGRFVTTRKTTE